LKSQKYTSVLLVGLVGTSLTMNLAVMVQAGWSHGPPSASMKIGSFPP
jgi:hypothetical protein